MIFYNEALSVLEGIATTHQASVETVKLDDAPGRILAASLISPEDVPSFTNSAMDGFAVVAANTLGATTIVPVQLPVRGIVAAGDLGAFRAASHLGSGVAVEIMTGAPVPDGGFDAVVRIEDVRVDRAADGTARTISISRPLRSGDNVRPKGTDFKVGQAVLSQGVRLTPEHILACASLGMSRLQVKARPRAVIVSTGSELVSPDESSLQPGMIRNSTGPFLVAAARRMGLDAKYLGIVRDDPKLYRKTLEAALSDGVDVVLSTGAVSMGKYDFVSDVLEQMGARTLFHKAAIRPGKPLLFAEFGPAQGKSAFFGVPGNPISTAVGMRFFVEPYLRTTLGLERERAIRATLSRDVVKPEGLRCFFKGRAQLGANGLEVEALKGQASYVVSALLEANCWVVLQEQGEHISRGTAVEIYPLHNSFESGVLS